MALTDRFETRSKTNPNSNVNGLTATIVGREALATLDMAANRMISDDIPAFSFPRFIPYRIERVARSIAMALPTKRNKEFRELDQLSADVRVACLSAYEKVPELTLSGSRIDLAVTALRGFADEELPAGASDALRGEQVTAVELLRQVDQGVRFAAPDTTVIS